MAWSDNLAQRSAREWALRGVLASAMAVVGYFGVTHSLAQVLMRDNVEKAHAIAPYDGRITARLAASLTGPDATEADRRRADVLARQALLQDPTAVLAASALGLNAQIKGQTPEARRLFAYAEKLSRRDLQTQLWGIEDAVAREDIPGALRHYDIALRTQPETSELLYPVLASASVDPEIRTPLIKVLVGRPPWGDGFVNYVASKGPDPRSAVQLLLALRGAGGVVPEAASGAAVNALIGKKLFDDAWAFYATLRAGLDRRQSRDPLFSLRLESPSVLDWVPINADGVNTSIQRGERGGVFDFMVAAGIGGPLLQQMQMLPPGDYRIEGHSIGIEQEESARPYWALRCGDGLELGRVRLPNSDEANGNFFGRFSVPAGCTVQTLILTAPGSDGAAGLSGQLDRVQLSAVR